MKKGSGQAVPAEVLQKIRQLEIRSRRAVDNIFSGEYHTVFKGLGMEFSEVRPYQPGDDVRAMDWNVSARTGEPFIKVFTEERELTLMLIVDLSASGSFGSKENFKVEAAAEICATLAFSAVKNNDKVGLIAFTDKIELFIPPSKGRGHILRLIRDILFHQPEGRGSDIKGALDYFNRVSKKKTITFLVSDFLAEGYENSLRTTAKKHDLAAIQVIDPAEESLPDIGVVALTDAETGETVYVDTSNNKLREEYHLQMKNDDNTLRRLFAGAKVDRVVIRCGEDFYFPLVRFFKERERRRSR